jgi:hypothetical protein
MLERSEGVLFATIEIDPVAPLEFDPFGSIEDEIALETVQDSVSRNGMWGDRLAGLKNELDGLEDIRLHERCGFHSRRRRGERQEADLLPWSGVVPL